MVAVATVPTPANGTGPAAMVSSPALSARRELTMVERVAAGAVVALVAVLGALGAVNSFERVAEAVEPSFGSLSWTVPLGVDIGIAAFTGLDLVMARLGVRMRWLRLVPWFLVAVTIYLNVAGEHTAVGAVAHGVLPGLWVIAVEAGGHVLRSWAGIDETVEDHRLDKVRISRWLLAPSSTVRLWRRMVLWEERSYPVALARERARLLVRTALQDRYGRVAWLWKAPRQQRVLYRLGELAPATVELDDVPPASSSSGAGAAGGGPPPSRRRRGPAPTTTRRPAGGRAKKRPPVPDVSDLLAPARRVAARITADGGRLTRDSLVAGLREHEGVSVANARAGHVLTVLRAELDEGEA